ncbi:hypothetical protein K1T71_013335 [Dendrolimus kikuchii]|uniref:Uncharacterized protein n=1 Tax=Dendrolimus kikuchii TaxID=765133 RepID=A0ACC1CHU4_9NEOP|nr:hypothetical protein K1T71_013335 [Dendrolimus kikuchii]
MVNYCIVSGCGRNNKNSKHLYFYGIPKETERQKLWLGAADRKDILKKSPEKRVTYRICSRHFSRQHFKNKHLCPDAVPTLHLPGYKDEDDSSGDNMDHENIICDNCNTIIQGFRYKCVTCLDYDLCSTCEMLETHSEHYMMRMPKPLKFKAVEDIVQQFRKFFNKQKNGTNDDTTDSDDEPITKYATKKDNQNYDSGIDLCEDIKHTINCEVDRVLRIQYTDVDKKSKKKLKTRNELSMARKRVGNVIETNVSNKKPKVDDGKKVLNMEIANVPEVAFADVNDFDKQFAAVKPESGDAIAQSTDSEPPPVMHMKLSDDFTELMIVMNDQKTTYKF